MELRFSLKLEFSYVLVNCQSPSLRKAEKKKIFVESHRRRMKIVLELETHIFYTVSFAILPMSLTFLFVYCVYVCILDKLLITKLRELYSC